MLRAGVVICCAALALVPAAASAAQPKLSIKRGQKVVAYTRSVSISGRLSTHRPGVRVLLQSDRWPFDSFRTVAGTKTGQHGGYRFKRGPVRGTRYRVVLKRRPAVGSRAVTVYLIPISKLVSCNYCRHGPDGHGTYTFRLTYEDRLPPGMSAHTIYFYWGQVDGNAWPPKVRLVKKIHPQQLGPGRVRVKIRYRFTVPDHEYSFAYPGCGRDHFARNGFGVPGHHHCGDEEISYPAYTGYLG
jgi:hypothetical protein